MDIRKITIDCDRCGRQHQIDVDYSTLSKDQIEGREPVLTNFICPDMALMYRVTSFSLDTTVIIFQQEGIAADKSAFENTLKAKWGEFDFSSKLERFIRLDLSYIAIPEEYFNLLQPVVDSYCCGNFYPAITSAGALGERILNRLIIKLRKYYKSTEQYSKSINKNSFGHWDLPISILYEWGILSDTVKGAFHRLKKYRNESIHYNEGYDFESNSHEAIKALADVING